ncbi:ATP-dependent Clp protease adapter ClpS [Desulfurivibrio sp. C05AmB]|jgi:ATP-dependent Clp protease adaptor protein ClpS|uniref:ATP-dependent Clp protease adapter ClpS n=1 Tax=Desulfurivibrio sp. C05AmB TaxID=3374371 RepID=UPI00376EFED2
MSPNSQDQQDPGVVTRKRQEVRQPPLYKVLLHNDDYTTMDFVVMVLENVFNHDPATANRIMMSVHKDGVGVAGIYPRDVAETKSTIVHSLARKHEYPLKCSLERE